MRPTKTYALALLLFSAVLLSVAQTQPPMHVGPLGGIREPLPRLEVPPQFQRFLPKGSFLRAVIHTRMALEGETWLLINSQGIPTTLGTPASLFQFQKQASLKQ
jgi:hypothetical protein